MLWYSLLPRAYADVDLAGVNGRACVMRVGVGVGVGVGVWVWVWVCWCVCVCVCVCGCGEVKESVECVRGHMHWVF